MIVRVVLGFFLLAAAGLKVYGLALDPFAQESLISSPRFQIASIEVETIVGLWLLSGWWVRGAWIAALGLFGILAVASLYLALVGQASCGCFGPVAVHPWWRWTFSLDVAAVAALGLWRPALPAGTQVGAAVQGLLKIGGGAFVLLVLTGGVLLLAFDNPMDALVRLRGESIRVEPRVSDLGEGPVGAERMFPLRLTNSTDRQIRIVGGTSNCSCIATESLPVTLSKGETKTVDIRVKFRGSPGRFRHRFALITDDETQGIVIAHFAGRVIGAGE